nr:HAD family hydrolase [uncultured Faecalimonas sp.]
MYQHILFDLDGTLTDPKVGITSAVAHALKFYGIEVEDLDTICKFIGPPLADSFMEYYGFDRERAAEAVEKYREYFSVRGLYENKVYPGIEQLLKELTEQGKNIYLATSKPEVYAKQILEHFHLTEYFTFIGGSELSGERVRKGDVIAYVLEQGQITDRDQVVMVGDRMHDVLGAKEQNLPCIGVLYGYGKREELEQAGAAMIKASVEELRDALRA